MQVVNSLSERLAVTPAPKSVLCLQYRVIDPPKLTLSLVELMGIKYVISEEFFKLDPCGLSAVKRVNAVKLDCHSTN